MKSEEQFLPVKVSVPAKIMLVGEYAVMEGYHSLSLALDKKLEVRITRTGEKFSKIVSSLWKEPLIFSQSSDLEDQEGILAETVYEGLKSVNSLCHFTLSVSSDFSVSSGFGSSSALRIAVLYALDLFLSQKKKNKILDKSSIWSLAKKAFLMQKSHQGHASGYDILTQKVGGIVSFKNPQDNWPGTWKKHEWDRSLLNQYLHIYTGGKGAPTKEFIISTQAWLEKNKLKEDFFKSSENLYKALLDFFLSKGQQNKDKVIQFFAQHRKILSASPGFPKKLDNLLRIVPGYDKKWTYKTTGSGGEDALLFFGELEDLSFVSEFMQGQSWDKESWSLDPKGCHYSLNEERFLN